MNRRVACVVLALVSLVAAGGRAARADDEPIRLPLTEAEIPEPRVDWYGLYMMDGKAKIGWARIELSKSGDAWVQEHSAHMTIEAKGRTTLMEMYERLEFDAVPPFAFRGGRSEKKSNDVAQTVEVVKGADGFATTSVQGGHTNSLPVRAIDYTLADAIGTELWFRQPRVVGDKLRVRAYSVGNTKARVDVYEVTDRKESAVLGVPTVFYEAAKSSDDKGNRGTFRVDTHGKLLSIVMGRAFEARLEPEETAKKTEKGGDLFVFGMAKLDKPIGPARNVKHLVLDVDGDGAKGLVDTPRQLVTRDATTGAVMISLGAGLGPDGATQGKEVEDALAETVGLPIRSPQVTALAAQAVGDAKTPREKVDRLVHFVAAYVNDELVPVELSVAEIIEQKKGDCSEHARLFAALARAAGVPARQVGGLMYMGDGAKAFGGHAWDEVVLDGKWVPVDPTWGETELDAAHVTTDREGKDADSMNTFGALSFRLKAVEHAK